MTDRVRASIVTPFLNPGAFLQEAIESVLAQTCPEWELLLVDDGSTDGSAGVAARYAAAHPERIRCFAHPSGGSKGASASRNLGIRHARGEYLAFLDADDVYLPAKLEEQLPLLDSHRDAAVLYAATQYWHSWTGKVADLDRDWTWRKFGVETDTVIDPPRMLVTFLRDGGTVPCMGSVLVRRRAVEAIGGWEESFRRICTDQVFHAKLCLRFAAVVHDRCWDRYRQHPGSSCQMVAAAGQSESAFEMYLTWLEGYLARQGVSDPHVWSALRSALRPYRHPLLHGLERRAQQHTRRVARAFASAGRRALRRAR
ncbi:MAG TPA: glycosyltransferase [Vicinamibacterales bacterium]|nr:glycosyltransferase [Vicinamibacterales bacterium]